MLSIISVISVISVKINIKCNNVHNYVIRVSKLFNIGMCHKGVISDIIMQ